MSTGSLRRKFGYLRPDSSQLGAGSLLRIIRMPPILPLEEMPYIVLSDYQSRPRTALVHNTHTAADIAAQEETSVFQSRSVNSQLVNTNNQELMGPMEQPLSDNPWAEEFTNVVVAGPAAANNGRGRSRASIIRAKLVKALVSGVVSLIVLPGIILGVFMKQAMAGIALSSAITALANLFAGLYYYMNKRD